MPEGGAATARRPATDGLRVGDRLVHLEVSGAWLVDPASGREGVADLVVQDGRIERVDWLPGDSGANGQSASGVDLLVLPGWLDLHSHLREPGGEAAETVASGMAAAAHGGFTRICAMPNTQPAIDDGAAVAGVLAAAERAAHPVGVLAYGSVSRRRQGQEMADLRAMAAAGAAGFSDDGSPVADPTLMREALTLAGELGLPIVQHPEDPSLTMGAEAHDGLAATILGLRAWPAAGEALAVERDLAILEELVAGQPPPPPGGPSRLHFTHLSCAASVELVREAKRRGLPVTADVTPHHLCLHEGWVGGDRRLAWEVGDLPWMGLPAQAAPYETATRVNPPLRTPTDARALATGLMDGTIDAIATDHAPHSAAVKQVEFGDAAPGISGLETALGLLLGAVEAGVLDLQSVARALTTGPAGVLGVPPSQLAQGAEADLVVIDRRDRWTVRPSALLSRGKNSPLLGRELAGRVLLTVSEGRIAYADPG